VYKTTDKKHLGVAAAKTDQSAAKDSERRLTARYQFTASAEVVEHATGARLDAHDRPRAWRLFR
jgi:hypothetical protein